MKLTFIGAAHEVTGSCHFLQAAGKNILVDYGLEQGKDEFENAELPVPASDIDYVFVTHAHIDHTGRIPLLEINGFKGQIFATRATCDLCKIMLLDSAHIQEFEAEWRNRKGQRRGKEPYVPLYTVADAQAVLERFVECDYNTDIEVCDGIKIHMTDAGHLLGSSSLTVTVTEDGQDTRIVFSGDVGNIDQPLINDPTAVEEADYVLIESTYGDRSHKARVDYVSELASIMQRTFERGGNLIIPSFAIGRTQEMLYFIRQIKEEQRLPMGFDVYVDSPLAVAATGIFNRHDWDCFDAEAKELVGRGINPISFPGLKLSVSSDDSKAINFDQKPKVILSASGMCEAGRIKHHLKHNLWRPECTVLFVGYQAVGTLGRQLLEGREEVTLFGEKVAVKAEILSLPGISGHADREGLLRWASHFKEKPKKVFVVHGDPTVVDIFAGVLKENLGLDTYAPYSGTVYDLTANELIYEAPPKPIAPKSEAGQGTGAPVTPGRTKAAAAFARLMAAGQRLMRLIKDSEGRPNKEMNDMARKIEDICDRWEG
ncbi:MAG: MBL fold metallo-hydrolase [Lachnospiraceae bacterium]|nr:MBL fold metallo-hydrolase [Lachnospiraceae bacterium]